MALGAIPSPPRPTSWPAWSGIGIGDDSVVVAYDDAGGTIAARLWWMLDDLGHRNVRVLDGGIGAWVAAGGPLTREVPAPRPGHLSLRSSWTRVIDREALVARLLEGDVTLLDARAPERYRGEVEPVDPVPGHIPGARSHPSANSLAPDGRFLGPERAARPTRWPWSRCRDVLRLRGHGVSHGAGDAAGRAAGPDPLPGLLQRLVAGRAAGGDR